MTLRRLLCLLLLPALFTSNAFGAEVDYCSDPAPAPQVFGAPPDDREALRGVEVGRIFWDVTIDSPNS